MPFTWRKNLRYGVRKNTINLPSHLEGKVRMGFVMMFVMTCSHIQNLFIGFSRSIMNAVHHSSSSNKHRSGDCNAYQANDCKSSPPHDFSFWTSVVPGGVTKYTSIQSTCCDVSFLSIFLMAQLLIVL